MIAVDQSFFEEAVDVLLSSRGLAPSATAERKRR